MPSFASSPCTRGAPQRGLALLMFRISSRISGATLGRPGLRRRLFQVQYRLNPQRCQRMTVSGFTMTRTLFQSVQILRNSTPKTRGRHSRAVAVSRNGGGRQAAAEELPWCTTPIEADSSLGPDSHHPIISLSGIPSAVMVFRILHPILASTLCAANPLARIAEPTIAL